MEESFKNETLRLALFLGHSLARRASNMGGKN